MTDSSTTDFPNLESVRCGADGYVIELMEKALPCRCGSRHLMPVSDAQYPPILAVACLDCDEIEGDAGTLAAAVDNWNAWTKAQPGKHVWVGTEGDDGEVCCMCGATPDAGNRDSRCPAGDMPPVTEPPECGEIELD
jgi:hypothetical protein